MREIGTILEEVCQEQGLWHYQAAKKLNVSTGTFSRYITGKTDMPDDVLAHAIQCFNCPELGHVRCSGCPVGCALANLRQQQKRKAA